MQSERMEEALHTIHAHQNSECYPTEEIEAYHHLILIKNYYWWSYVGGRAEPIL